MKYCTKCETQKSDEDFYLDKSRKDGLSSNCKECKRKRQRELLPKEEGLASPTKVCSGCKRVLPRDSFGKMSTGFYGLQGYCLECKPLDDKRRLMEKTSEVFLWVASIKEQSGCMDCPENMKNSHPYYRLDFDHVRGTKEFNIGSVVRKSGYTRDILQKEIDKCEVVCANCHRDRTHKRMLENNRA